MRMCCFPIQRYTNPSIFFVIVVLIIITETILTSTVMKGIGSFVFGDYNARGCILAPR